jgi:hypothetical protein
MANNQEIVRIFDCPSTSTNKFGLSEKPFADAFGFEIVNTTINGDCFFHALQEYGKRTDYKILRKSRKNLREDLVSYMLTNPNVQSFISIGVYSKAAIDQIKESYEYTCDACDLVQVFSNSAFNINLYIYKLNYSEEENRNYITFLRYLSPLPTQHTVCVLYTSATGESRSNNHYKLLFTQHTKEQLDQQVNEHRSNVHKRSPQESSLEKALRQIAEAENRKSRKKSRSRSRSHSHSRSHSRNIGRLKEKRNTLKAKLHSMLNLMNKNEITKNQAKQYKALEKEYKNIKDLIKKHK